MSKRGGVDGALREVDENYDLVDLTGDLRRTELPLWQFSSTQVCICKPPAFNVHWFHILIYIRETLVAGPREMRTPK